ncbi:hypothetical protein CONPUDRAFT_73877 [Coniophora puteana RWD-64-598 SS2]|uniref:Uncharacterized protein n=1 Tax=Coniophora puteana (strain RWD-64-598) TaxID=741705 RepID=A0A5M3MQA4_CONPW|nr:uncharacterized protein CONPUDRAFT_73877 [Coniophora puteana RWD-64-598 SS2]EIW80865.1 hypothetical protein CONPUDRAFT_73877 [Coniophora puteana RWD-64-598 SS2]
MPDRVRDLSLGPYQPDHPYAVYNIYGRNSTSSVEERTVSPNVYTGNTAISESSSNVINSTRSLADTLDKIRITRLRYAALMKRLRGPVLAQCMGVTFDLMAEGLVQWNSYLNLMSFMTGEELPVPLPLNKDAIGMFLVWHDTSSDSPLFEESLISLHFYLTSAVGDPLTRIIPISNGRCGKWVSGSSIQYYFNSLCGFLAVHSDEITEVLSFTLATLRFLLSMDSMQYNNMEFHDRSYIRRYRFLKPAVIRHINSLAFNKRLLQTFNLIADGLSDWITYVMLLSLMTQEHTVYCTSAIQPLWECITVAATEFPSSTQFVRDGRYVVINSPYIAMTNATVSLDILRIFTATRSSFPPAWSDESLFGIPTVGLGYGNMMICGSDGNGASMVGGRLHIHFSLVPSLDHIAALNFNQLLSYGRLILLKHSVVYFTFDMPVVGVLTDLMGGDMSRRRMRLANCRPLHMNLAFWAAQSTGFTVDPLAEWPMIYLRAGTTSGSPKNCESY